MKLLNWLSYKLLWYRMFAAFIKQNNLHHGAELGVKAGRSFAYFLRTNPQLEMVGMDLWEDQPGSPYAHNTRNEKKCRKRSRRFGERAQLIKGDASKIAGKFSDRSFDFVFYDCFNYRISSPELWQGIMQPWVSKIKHGGYLISRDFHEPDNKRALRAMGLSEPLPLIINGKPHMRLKYVPIP